MSPLLSGNCCATDALLTGTRIQRDLKLKLGICNKKQGFYRFLKNCIFCVKQTICESKKFQGTDRFGQGLNLGWHKFHPQKS